MQDNIKKIIIIIIGIIILSLFSYGTYYILSAKTRDGDTKANNPNAKYTISSAQLDKLEQPKVNEKVTLDTLPKTSDTLSEIDINTLKKLFQTSKKSIVVVEKDNCPYCNEYEPILIDALKYFKINAYKINLSTIKNISKVSDYLYYEGTPTTFIIQNSKVLHTLSGAVDESTIKSFIDYFYIRNN